MPIRAFTDDEVLEGWNAVAELKGRAVDRHQTRTLNAQPELAMFTLAFTEVVNEDGRSLAVFVLHCVLEVFRRQSAKLRGVTERSLVAQWPRSVDRVRALSASLAESGDAETYISAGPQPAVLRAVLEALADDEDDPVPLSNLEYWLILAVLDTVVVVLQSRATPRRSASGP